MAKQTPKGNHFAFIKCRKGASFMQKVENFALVCGKGEGFFFGCWGWAIFPFFLFLFQGDKRLSVHKNIRPGIEKLQGGSKSARKCVKYSINSRGKFSISKFLLLGMGGERNFPMGFLAFCLLFAFPSLLLFCLRKITLNKLVGQDLGLDFFRCSFGQEYVLGLQIFIVGHSKWLTRMGFQCLSALHGDRFHVFLVLLSLSA